MTRTKFYFSLSLLLFISSCSNTDEEISDKGGCSSIDGCLSIYDFEQARKIAGEGYFSDDELKKITISESKYWADKGEIDRALAVVDESWGIDDYEWKESDWQAWRYNIIDKGVTTCCEKGDYRQAKIYALKASEELNIDGLKIGSGTERYLDKQGNEHDHEGRTHSDCKELKAKGPSMRESLLKKISQYEELVK
jgi:hypothetical protein